MYKMKDIVKPPPPQSIPRRNPIVDAPYNQYFSEILFLHYCKDIGETEMNTKLSCIKFSLGITFVDLTRTKIKGSKCNCII